MDIFEGIFGTKEHFKTIPITIVACNKHYRLLRIDVLKKDTIKLINSIKTEDNIIDSLRGYRLSIRLKENH